MTATSGPQSRQADSIRANIEATEVDAVERVHTVSEATPIPFEGIQEPGTYICHQTGHLIRLVAGDEHVTSRSPLIDILGSDRELVFVTKISNDPFVPISKARMAAANLDVEISF